MSSSNQITPFDGYGGDAPEPGQGTALARSSGGGGGALAMGGGGGLGGGALGGAELPAGSGGGMGKRVHNALRGRYWIAIVLGVIFGGTGGYFGWKSQQPVYRGEAMIMIAYNLPVVGFGDGRQGPMLNFEEYLQSQAMMMTTRTILNGAMESKEWEKTGLGNDPVVAAIVAKNLTVEHPSRTEIIRIFYTDKNPEVARTVVRSVVKAYKSYSEGRTYQEDNTRFQKLGTRHASLKMQLDKLDAQILDAANLFGTANLEQLVDSKLQEESSLEKRFHELELALDAAKRKKDAKTAVMDLTENQIAMIDPVLRGMLMERENVLNEIARLEAMGVLSGNNKMKSAVVLRDGLQKKVDRYVGNGATCSFAWQRILRWPAVGSRACCNSLQRFWRARSSPCARNLSR